MTRSFYSNGQTLGCLGYQKLEPSCADMKKSTGIVLFDSFPLNGNT